MVSVIEHVSDVLRAYYRNGEQGLADVADRLHERAHDQSGGQFGKREARYLPQSPFPPMLWRYQCSRCRFWQEGGPGEAGRCHVVGREGDPWGGEAIHPRAWCGLWMPPAGEPAFAWLRERLHPDGASNVRGEYRSALTAGETGEGTGGYEVPVTAAEDETEADRGTEADGGTEADDG